jgi:hypothetical protein
MTSFNPSPGNDEEILKIYEPPIYGEVHCVTKSFYQNVLTIAAP